MVLVLARLGLGRWDWLKIQLRFICHTGWEGHASRTGRCVDRSISLREVWMDAELTIVIPAKNEVAMLPKLLESLCRQDYAGMRETRVLVADAGSTDGTVEA